MIHYINGTVKLHTQSAIIIEAGPIGLSIQVPKPSTFELNKPTQIHTYLHWNQENGPTLYGFEKDADRTVFSLIIGCPGIGPKIGLAVLAQLGAQGFIEAIQIQNGGLLSKVNGIGPRKAEQIVMQLKDKVSKLLSSGLAIETTKSTQQWHLLTQALESLNYSRTEITHVMSKLQSNATQVSPTFDQLMRQALSFLSKQG